MSEKPINAIIQNRRSIFPNMYSGQPVSDEVIQQLLENANHAPNHRHTEPWRFKVFTGKALERLGNHLAELYERYTPEEKYSQIKQKKIVKKTQQSTHIIAICMQRDPQESLPEWEEMCAVACAVQNMWLTASAYDLGTYWSTPGLIERSEMGEFLNLKDGEKCMGFFYIGHYDGAQMPTKRTPIQEKVVWVRE